MRTLSIIAAAIAVFTVMSFGAQAMTAAPLKGAASADQSVTQVAGGCGRGWHRGPHGHCRRN